LRYFWRDGAWRDSDGNKMEAHGDGVCAPAVQSDTPEYYSIASGKMVDGRRARRDDLARTGCREVDPSEGPKTVRSKALAKKLGLEHDPNAGRPRHWDKDWSSTRIENA
jgi:hypothetical protein